MFGRVVQRPLLSSRRTFFTSQLPTSQFQPLQFRSTIQPQPFIQQQQQQLPKIQLSPPTQPNFNSFTQFLRPTLQQPQQQAQSKTLSLNVGIAEEQEGLHFTSVLRKRRVKMNRHKLKKRRKKQRFLTRKATK